MGQLTILNKFARKKPQLLRRGPGYFEKARHALFNGTLIIKKLPGAFSLQRPARGYHPLTLAGASYIRNTGKGK